MADKKISQLTLASTPLSGGETLPVVQTGATVQVSVNNLTAGRAVSATSISAGLGAVGAPSYTFTGDTNTGMWSPSADALAFSTAGAERMRLDSSGNVLVATTSASTGNTGNGFVVSSGGDLISRRISGVGRTHVTFVNGGVTVGTIQTSTTATTYNTSSTSGLTGVDADTVAIRTNSAERIRIDSAGNVGIGITAPRSILSAASATGSVLTLESTDTTLTTNDVVGEIDFYANDGSTNGTGVKASIRAFANDAAGNNIALAFATSDGTTLAADRMILDGQGRLGIGTTTPAAAARLDVSSTTSGFLPPRMTGAQRDLIATPPDGLMLYNSTTNKLQVRAAGSWVDLH